MQNVLFLQTFDQTSPQYLHLKQTKKDVLYIEHTNNHGWFCEKSLSTQALSVPWLTMCLGLFSKDKKQDWGDEIRSAARQTLGWPVHRLPEPHKPRPGYLPPQVHTFYHVYQSLICIKIMPLRVATHNENTILTNWTQSLLLLWVMVIPTYCKCIIIFPVGVQVLEPLPDRAPCSQARLGTVPAAGGFQQGALHTRRGARPMELLRNAMNMDDSCGKIK